MAEPFLLQMAGVPGSGKSALARLIGRCTGAVVIDKDILKTAALEVGVAEQHAGETAYEAFFALADHMLGQGLSVILDSPSFWETIPTKGTAIATEREVRYYFIECLCTNDIRDRSPPTREATAGQPARRARIGRSPEHRSIGRLPPDRYNAAHRALPRTGP